MGLKDLAKQVKKEKKEQEKPIEEQFIGAIDKYLISSEKKREDSRTFVPAIQPSSYYKCPRMQWYKILGFPKSAKPFARSVRILAVGTITHEWIQREVFMKLSEQEGSPIKLVPKEEIPVARKSSIDFFSEHNAPPMEVKFRDYSYTEHIPISAMVDGIINFAGRDMIFEFKTINTKDFGNLIEPSPDYIKQGAIYSLCLGIPFVMFLYIDKNDQSFKAYLVEYTKEQLEWVKNRVATIESYVDEKVLPPKEPHPTTCRYCKYKSLCDKDLGEGSEFAVRGVQTGRIPCSGDDLDGEDEIEAES